MKKLLLSSAMLAVSSMAAAQSSVTLFGITAVAVSRGTGSVADRTQLTSGGNSSSRIGFRGVEDLGGGLSAGFWLESAILADSGAGGTTNTNNQTTGTTGGGGLTFGRRSTVSLTSGWGELRLGRDYSAQFYNFQFDPFGNNGVGQSQAYVGSLRGPASERVSNAIMYFLPGNSTGIYGQVQYYLGENASNAGATADDGKGGGVRLGWRSGPLNVSASYVRTQYATTANTGDLTKSNIAARYDSGAFSVMGLYARDRLDRITALTGHGAQIGGIWRIGAGEVKGLLSQYKTTAAGNPETKKLSLGYVHHLSKRTALFTTWARVRNSGGATTALNGSVTAANQSSSGLDVGIRHSF